MTATPHLPRLSQLPPARRRLLAMVLVAVAVLALAIPLGLKALQGASTSSSSSAASAGEASRGAVTGSGVVGPDLAPQADASAGAKAPAADTGTLGNGVAASVAVIEPKIARSAWLGIKVTDLTGSAARARVIATDAGGQVTSENVVTSVDPTGGPTGPGGVDPRLESGSSLPTVGVDEARMVLSVPAKTLDDVLTQLSRIGTVSYRSSQSQDVTDTYVDTKARIEPMQDGITRVRALLTKTTDLQQVILLESELTRRQAELDSLTQRLAQLDAMTTTSDVTVTLWTDATTPVQTDSGLGGGLRTAWESFLGSLTVILTGLAALLPWLVLLVPLTLLALRLWRRRVAGTPAAAFAVNAAPAAGPTPQPAGAPASAPASTTDD
ncbi:hypothetical protein ASE25_10450 [Terrabacter sp. Root85]|uniref:DUF4349 domain-containing protein n=1 Tax=Terrabacter sp. Root85 TaxID=1736603 RepID=UPI000715E550|nr:DUF4349 domain-containing protein [Terrabacter sp. Root85]KRC89928.1 hypothetical protein ASE25_10450 [Terrabacter sp. Root85]